MSTEDQWLTKRFVISMVLIIGLAGPAIATLISPFFDQGIRNLVDHWMSDPDIFGAISITQDEYAQLPMYWRQALAEITLRPKEEAIDVQRLISSMTLEDIMLIDLLAPYATNIGILRDNKQLSEHPMPELSYKDFSHFEDIGILEDVSNGMTLKIPTNSKHSLEGTTVLLRFKTEIAKKETVLEVTGLTRGGQQLIDALRVPSNIAYFEWFANNLEEEGCTVDLFATGIKKSSMSEKNEIQGRLERHTIPAWPL